MQVTVFDHRGCPRAPKEYTGKPANGAKDGMMVKVSSEKIETSESLAAFVLQSTVGILKTNKK